MDTSPSDVAYFLEVANTLNISRAARRLGISQPSLSVAVKRLESVFGTPLLVRKKSGVELTKSGRYLVSRGKALIQDWEGLKAGVLSQATTLTGRFSIGAHPSVARYTLPAFLPALLQDVPGIEIHLEHDLSRKITEAVIAYELDFGFVVNPTAHPDLVIHRLGLDEISLWSKDGKLSDLLLLDPSLHQAQVILRKLEAKKIRFKRTLTSSSLDVLVDLARAGAGVAILPGRVVHAGGGGLKSCGKAYPAFSDQICFVYRVETPKSAAARAVISVVRGMKF